MAVGVAEGILSVGVGETGIGVLMGGTEVGGTGVFVGSELPLQVLQLTVQAASSQQHGQQPELQPQEYAEADGFCVFCESLIVIGKRTDKTKTPIITGMLINPLFLIYTI